MTNTATAQTVTIGTGSAIHVGYFTGDKVTGSLCNPYAWQRSRVRLSDQPATCPRCAKATHRAKGARPAAPAGSRDAIEADLGRPMTDAEVAYLTAPLRA